TPVEAYRNLTNRDASSDGARTSALGGGFVRTRYSFSLGMAISRDGGEWGDVRREHPLSIASSFDGYHLRAAPGRPNVSCSDGGGGRAAGRQFGGHGFCHALHERLAAVCGDLVRASNRSHVYSWPIGRKACAALVARWALQFDDVHKG